MTLRAFFGAVCLFASVAFTPATRAALVSDSDEPPLCEPETVYGTVIIFDDVLGVFGLLGTRYKFQSMEELDLEYLQGRMVRIDIGADCGILDLRVIDGEFDSVT